MPPLPEKHSLLNYAPIPKVGKEEHLIIEKRKRMLVSFLHRVCAHPVLGRDHIFHRFLENSEPMEIIFNQEEFPFSPQTKSLTSSIITSVVSMTVGSPIASASGPDRNIEVSNRRVESVVNNIVKTHRAMMKLYQDLSSNFIELASGMNALSMEHEEDVGPLLEKVGKCIQSTQEELSTLVSPLNINFKFSKFFVFKLEFNQNFYDDLKELLQFTGNLKGVLANRLQLQEKLEKTKKDLESHQKTVALLESGQTIGPDSFVGKLSKTFRDLTDGGDSTANRHVTLVKSRDLIPVLNNQIQKIESDLKVFEENFLAELDYYEKMRLMDWKYILHAFAKSQVAYYEKVKLYI